MAPPPIEFLFQGEDLRVYVCRAAPTPSDTIVFCFHGRIPKPGFQTGNFGQSFLIARGIDAIHVQASRNSWYQSPETEAAIAAAERAARAYPQRVTYGSSMGAYAAVAFSGPLGATGVAAFVPQFSPAAAKVPFETRWSEERAAIPLPFDDMDAQISRTARIFLAYDPYFSQDRQHADLIGARTQNLVRLTFPFVDHEVLRFLGDSKLIDEVVTDAIRGVASGERYRDRVRARRAWSSTYFFYAGQVLLRRNRVELAWRYFHRAMDLPTGQFDHYNRILMLAKRTKAERRHLDPVFDIAARRPENQNLAAALAKYRGAVVSG